MNQAILQVKDLCVNFNTFYGKARAIDKICLIVWQKETMGLVGETGCGKSVTLKAILGILPIPPGEIASGEIVFDGRDILRMNEKELR